VNLIVTLNSVYKEIRAINVVQQDLVLIMNFINVLISMNVLKEHIIVELENASIPILDSDAVRMGHK